MIVHSLFLHNFRLLRITNIFAWRLLFFFVITVLLLDAQPTAIRYDQTREGHLVFHPIKTDSKGNILPWYHPDLGISLQHAVLSTWNFWENMKKDPNGLPYYMSHQVWREKVNDPRGIGGDQLQMMMSSLQLLYMYTGNEKIKENLRFLADYYVSHSFSPEDAAYPNIPYPYNNLLYSGWYDGDMVLGPGYTQPDKAGSLGWELVKMAHLMSNYFGPKGTAEAYWDFAIKIADCLALNCKPGDEKNSPLPFKVHAKTGKIGVLKEADGDIEATYTSNWVPTLLLFEGLILMKKGNVASYQKAHQILLEWMKAVPLKKNKWGPFFEDVPGWSDTQINAITFAEYILLHPQYFPNYKDNVKSIFNWVYEKLSNKQWNKYGVTVVNEQTAYQVPGNSHTARQAATELLYTKLTGDSTYYANALRALAWVTYMVDHDGKNCYPRDEIWLTDGYGDYIRHLLKAFAWFPQLAPEGENHMVHTTGFINTISYAPDLNKRLQPDVLPQDTALVQVHYRTSFENTTETLRLKRKPTMVKIWNDLLPETKKKGEPGWHWQPLSVGGILTVTHKGIEVKIY